MSHRSTQDRRRIDGKPVLLPRPKVLAVDQQVDDEDEAQGTAEAHEDVAQ